MMWMAGWRFEDDVTTDDVLRLVARQRSLNFAPGDETLYSNTGFTLLGVVVERVAGMSLSRFSRERIFEPLGMKDTLIQDDHHQVVKRRAVSYRPAKGGGYESLLLSDSTIGQSGVVTTIGDLARWDQNFDDGKVGGNNLIAQMLERGRRNNGELTRYAAGLGVDEYRGLQIVEHSGSVAAYRSHYLRFPTQRLSVIILANAEDLPATEFAHRIADICQEDHLKRQIAKADPPAPSADVELPPDLFDAYTGDYQRKPGDFVTISREGAKLMVQGTGSGRVELTPASQTLFRLPRKGAYVAFVKPQGANRAESIRLGVEGREQETATRIDPPPAAGLVGDYYSHELDVIYHVRAHEGEGSDGQLLLVYPRGVIEMKRTVPDSFDVPFPLRSIRFDRDDKGRATGFILDGERARQLRFERIELDERK